MTTVEINPSCSSKIEPYKFYIHATRKCVIYIKSNQDGHINLIDFGYVGQFNKDIFGNQRTVRREQVENHYIPFHGEILIKSE